jgi:hypothetical protein
MFYKTCPKCGEKKPATKEFFQGANTKGYKYLRTKCKICRNKEKKEWNEKNKEHIKEYNKQRWIRLKEERLENEI